MLFTEENGRRSKTYDFTILPLSAQLQQWLAAAFARDCWVPFKMSRELPLRVSMWGDENALLDAVRQG
ncbi:hypothetical protein, partial [Streptomyces sp. NPDC127084]|uniref:hypothetical protein n=1 Tax=Streptomyces sp. NPDC127084 TaxID=3347133 RepID=UPI0036569D99